MDARAQLLIESLSLAPHPEGGYFRELHRSATAVVADGATRCSLTCIYYLLARGERSRWHRLRAADELWHHLEGDPLELLVADAELSSVERRVLGRFGPGQQPQAVVRARSWQAARPLGAYALVGCSVGPGFEFSDFQLLADLPNARERLSLHLSTTEDLL